MGRISWTSGDTPLAPFADGYRELLAGCGYTPGSAKHHLLLMGQLSLWMSSGRLDVGQLSSEQVDEFLAGRRAGGQRRVPTRRSLLPLLSYLQDLGIVPPVSLPAPTATEELLARYATYLGNDRGLAPSTVKRYLRMARRFLTDRSSMVGGTGAEDLRASEILAYLRQAVARLGVGSAKREAGDLRSLLRFLYRDRIVETDLGTALPPVAGWRDTAVPPTLAATEIAALLDSCDRDRPGGMRDFAILTILARLGLRSGEVAGLVLDDIDWRAGELVVRGKARRLDRLPLPVDVGEAIASYLRAGRPPSGSRCVFLTNYAPARPIHPSSITNVVYRACRRADVRQVGPHRLRHALATDMLRQGAKLVDVSQVLRHQDLATTAVYAKVDFATLRLVAQPWPGAVR